MNIPVLGTGCRLEAKYSPILGTDEHQSIFSN